MLIELIELSDRAIRIHKIVIVLVRDIQLGAVSTDHQVFILGKEGVMVCQSLGHLAELRIRWARKPRDVDDHLAGMTKLTGAAITQVTMEALIRQIDPPFMERVMKVRVPSRFKLPSQLRVYEGKIGPMDLLDSYKNLMMIQGCLDEVMCKAFSTTLNGATRSWFKKLSPRTIDSFGDLSRLFVANFMNCRVRQKNVSHFFIVYQKDGESLKDYVRHFNQVVIEVEDPSDKVVIMAMMGGLRSGLLFDSLSKIVLNSGVDGKMQTDLEGGLIEGHLA
ncbi:hypothetical protein Acr_04g0004010 [Actinidia rufa]|uniref:Retrotransposon gag domain-containing protein n=1 Tax=Actinidia rufa TaxID=165716 RepID=A0A7J0EGR2_9ERIC|nr:hypothetical protein Acr_04g0004010 [Actinidia rufa]